MSKDTAIGMKSAYELALERLDKQGIERPRADSLTDEVRAEIAEARSRAEAKLAEVEILFKDKIAAGTDPEAEANYLTERRRIEDDRDRKIEKLRRGN